MHQRPVVLVDVDWSYGRGCRKQETDHSFECFFTRFANQCSLVEGFRPEAIVRTASGLGPYVSWAPSQAAAYWVGGFGAGCPMPDAPLAVKVTQ